MKTTSLLFGREDPNLFLPRSISIVKRPKDLVLIAPGAPLPKPIEKFANFSGLNRVLCLIQVRASPIWLMGDARFLEIYRLSESSGRQKPLSLEGLL